MEFNRESTPLQKQGSATTLDLALESTQQQCPSFADFSDQLSPDTVSEIVVVDQKDDRLVPVKTYTPAKYPFDMSKFTLVGLITLYCILCGTHYYNWTRWELILLKNHAFQELCDSKVDSCQAQQLAISGLLPLTTLLQFTFTLVAGVLLDSIGPKLCSAMGVSLLIVAWIPLLTSNPSSSVYRFSYAMMGAGSDPAFFGTLNIANIFTGFSSTVISVFGAARGLTNLVPHIADILSNQFPEFTLKTLAWFFFAAMITCLIMVILFIPFTPYVLATSGPHQTALSDPKDSCTVMSPSQTSSRFGPNAGLPTNKTIYVSEESVRKEIVGPAAIAIDTIYTDMNNPVLTAGQPQTFHRDTDLSLLYSNNVSEMSVDKCMPRTSFSGLPSGSQMVLSPDGRRQQAYSRRKSMIVQARMDKSSVLTCKPGRKSVWPRWRPTATGREKLGPNLARETDTHALPVDQDEIGNALMTKIDLAQAVRVSWHQKLLPNMKAQAVSLGKVLMTKQYIALCIVTITNIVRNNFFLTTAIQQLGHAEPMLAILNSLAFIPGPVCGYLVDRFGPLAVLTGINVFNSALFIDLTLIQLIQSESLKRILQYLAVVLSFPGIGYLLSQIYTYIAVHYSPEDLGKLAGFSNFLAGLLGYFVVPLMVKYAAHHDDHLSMNLANVGFSMLSFVCLGILYHERKSSQLA